MTQKNSKPGKDNDIILNLAPQILELLKEQDRTAGEIADFFSISKPSISHHLAQLKQADLVLDERQGQNIVYSLNTTVFQEFLRFFLDLTNKEEVESK